MSIIPALLQAPWTQRARMILGLQLSAAWHCGYWGPGPNHSVLGTGLLRLSLAHCQVSMSPAQSACGVAGGNSPHKHTRTMLEGRREPAGCCCSGCVLLPGATLLVASLAPSLSSRLCLSVRLQTQGPPPASSGSQSWLGGGLVCSLASDRGCERERSHRKYPTLTSCRPLQLIPLVGVPAPLGCPSGVGRVHLSKVQQCQVFG